MSAAMDRCGNCGHARELHGESEFDSDGEWIGRTGVGACHYLPPHHMGGSCDPKRCAAFVEPPTVPGAGGER